ncbi:MAG: hypothetical protein J6W76_08675, partial [Spirochaetales bacterium]|nr:hypothetical protein [Spirochaetales bacterium]
MKKLLLSVMPFIAVLVFMLGSVWLARVIHCPSRNVYHVNTGPSADGMIHSVRVFDRITAVMIIDMHRHAKKKKITPDKWTYNPQTTQMTFAEPLPFKQSVVHIEGVAVQPEQFCLHDFDGMPNQLLVLLDDHEAIRNYDYIYNEETHIITFRSDIHPEKDGTFLIMYQTKDGATHSFGNWNPATNDRIAKLQWQWMHRTQNAPMLVMLDRSRVSNRRLSREVGFQIRLPKSDSTFISETVEGSEKRQTVMRWYGEIITECKNVAFSDNDIQAEQKHIVHIGKQNVTKQEIIGTRSNPDGSTEPVPLVLYHWTDRGT